MSLNNNSSSSNNSKSAISNVVNDLIRSAVGGDARNVGDEDLDKYVADMILKEAEAKSKKYQSVGVSAYMPDQPNNLPKPNKRFLLNMVRATDSHNQALREQQERAKEKERRERLQQREDEDNRRYRHSNRRRRRSPYDEEHSRHYPRRYSVSPSHSPNESHHSRSKRSISPVTHLHKRHHDSSSAHDNNRQDQPNTNAMDTASSSSKPVATVVVRGRGRRTEGTKSSMDKYFAKDYNPFMDIEPDLDQMVYTEYPDDDNTLKPAKKKKKDKKKKSSSSKKKKSSKKRKRDTTDESDESSSDKDDDPRRKKRHHRHHHKKKKSKDENSNSDSNSDSGEDVWVEEPKPVRAWDVGKEDLH
ncbi:hypothetical protein K492DRAFT_235811 [Lichtheimia hyalospora FSU 10163]|nr:hypothetical protein K492DRAFT_235811 [Lichtheimia hyalospora FSU 10163]